MLAEINKLFWQQENNIELKNFKIIKMRKNYKEKK